MNPKIVPNVFALNKEEFDKKLKILDFAKEIHLDFMDGKFTKNSSVAISDMKEVKKYSNKIFNIHLMAYNPISYLDEILSLGIKKVYVQFEVYGSDFKLLHDLKLMREKGLKTGIVLNPDTSVSALNGLFEYLDSVMIMSVWPGEEHQEFIEYTLSKIRDLRNLGYRGEIAFDGGVKDVNAKKIIESGASTLYIGSYISGSKNAKESYKKIVDLVKN